ncbi:hypothetical protein CEXT_663431 [Caerostris extrusa]|uniref:Uncharacterized protein n=1 Tax=Caerostris extrusa TaxID=172846 RepID=A0AAV4RWG8_CAEEX|nr:hypothetical protein CEXT_663431 [Caerostris extrusa]
MAEARRPEEHGRELFLDRPGWRDAPNATWISVLISLYLFSMAPQNGKSTGKRSRRTCINNDWKSILSKFPVAIALSDLGHDGAKIRDSSPFPLTPPKKSQPDRLTSKYLLKDTINTIPPTIIHPQGMVAMPPPILIHPFTSVTIVKKVIVRADDGFSEEEEEKKSERIRLLLKIPTVFESVVISRC